MIDGLIRWSLKYRTVVIVLAAAFLVWGGYAMTEMPLDVLPDLTAPTVSILVEGNGMVPTEMEALVAFPIETALNGAPGIRRVRSISAVGILIVFAEFEWGTDIYRARQTVTEKLNAVSGSLPATVEKPFLGPVSSIMGDIMFIAIQSKTLAPVELRAYADTVLRRRLLAVPGVSQVIPIGSGQKQYQVLVAPHRMLQYNVTLTEVENALRDSNRNSSAGFRVAGGQEYLIHGVGRVSTTGEIEGIVISSREGRPIFVRDVARVEIGPAFLRGEAAYNGERAIILSIQKQPDANTLQLTRELDVTLDSLQKALPPGIQLKRDLFRQADFIELALSNLTRALRDGSILVLIVVVVFLFNARAAFITLLALPLSLVAAVLAMKWFGMTINAMSLGGLAIAIGELVDDAIIDVENVVRRLRENALKPEAERDATLSVVYRASSEIRTSVVFATVIVCLVFTPLFLLDSVEGRLLKPLGFAYVASLIASLIVALTVTPALCSLLLPRMKSILSGHEPWVVRKLKVVYDPILRGSMRHPFVVLGVSAAMLAAAVFSFTRMGRSFLPEFNEGALTVGAITVPGTSLEESDRLGRALEKILLTVPEVVATGRRTGRAELDEHLQGVESSEAEVTLKTGTRTKAEMLADIRDKLKLLPGVLIEIGQPISHRIDHMLSGTRANIAVKIFGDDLLTLRRLAAQVRESMEGVPGVVDLAAEQQVDVPMLRIKVNAAAAARYGMSAGQVTHVIQTAFFGAEMSQILEGQIGFPLFLRYDRDGGETVEAMGRTLIDTPAGARVPLATLADIREDRGPNIVSRESVQRKIVVKCNTAGRDLRSVVDDIRRHVDAQVKLPPGYRVEYGGQFESEAAASRRLSILGVGVVIGILLLLTTAFGNVRDALIVMLNLPLALVGGVIGVFVSGGVLSVASIIGFITLFGITTRNGIMLVSHVRHLMRAEGVTNLREAVYRGARERVSPILMTALAAGLALIPIALGGGKPGSEIQSPMAMVILFGLLSSTLLNMIVVPAVMLRFGRA